MMILDENQALSKLREVNAVLTDGHFVYTSERHGTAYVNKDAVYLHTNLTSLLCRAIVEKFAEDYVQAVVAPAVGGVALSQWCANHLTQIKMKDILAAYADKEGEDSFVIKRGYDKVIAGKNVLVVEDTLTTGGSARKTVEAVRSVGGIVVGVGVLCNRGGITAEQIEVPRLFSLTNVPLESWPAEECPLCAQGVPINTDVGKGRQFLAAQAAKT